MPSVRVVARWKSTREKYWVELLHNEAGYFYRAVGAEGTLPPDQDNDYKATTWMLQNRVRSLFPDNQKTIIREV